MCYNERIKNFNNSDLGLDSNSKLPCVWAWIVYFNLPEPHFSCRLNRENTTSSTGPQYANVSMWMQVLGYCLTHYRYWKIASLQAHAEPWVTPSSLAGVTGMTHNVKCSFDVAGKKKRVWAASSRQANFYVHNFNWQSSQLCLQKRCLPSGVGSSPEKRHRSYTH